MLDLNGQKMIIATNDLPPFIFLDKKPLIGTEAKFLLTLSQFFNFTYELVNYKFNFGEKLANNTWTGMIGDLVSNQVNFAIFDMYITYDRTQALTYTYPYFVDLVTFSCPLPKIRTKDINLIEPFDITIWILLAINTLVILIISFIFYKTESHVFWTIVSIFMKQQIHLHSNIRRLFFFWLLAGIVLTSSYAGIIYSMLASIIEEDRIETLQQLSTAAKSQKITVIGLNKGIYFNMIKETKTGVIGDIGSRIEGVANISVAISLLKSSKAYAFILAKEMLCYAIHSFGVKSHYIPDNTNLDSVFAINFVGVPMSNDFPYKAQFNTFMSRAFKGGLFDYWRRTFYYDHFGKDMDYFSSYLVNNYELNSINNDQLSSIYIVLAIGLIISTIIFLFEYILKTPGKLSFPFYTLTYVIPLVFRPYFEV